MLSGIHAHCVIQEGNIWRDRHNINEYGPTTSKITEEIKVTGEPPRFYYFSKKWGLVLNESICFQKKQSIKS